MRCYFSEIITFAGYFVYDLIDIAANKKLSKLWEVIPHHLAVSMTIQLSFE